MRKFHIIEKYKSLKPIIPTRATSYSAGYDFASLEEVTINPKEIVFIKTGIKVEMNEDDTLLIFARSSLGIKKGLMLSNSVGVIDQDYFNNDNNEGHIMFPLYNFKDTPVTILKDEKVCQGIFTKYYKTDDDEPLSNNRVGGFGSSHKLK